jgi:YidC/Oxa1 family membrane protein insertase
MEQRNLLIAIALSFLVFLLWSVLFVPKPVPKTEEAQKEAASTGQAATSQPAQSGLQTPAVEEPLIQSDQQSATASRPARTLTIDAPLYKMVLTEKGAAIKSMVLKNYRETIDKDSPAKEIIPAELSGGTALLSTSGTHGKLLENALYTLDASTDSLAVGQQPLTIRFVSALENGLQAEKAFTFYPDSYLVKLEVTLFNGSSQSFNENIALVLQQIIHGGNSGYGFEGPSGLVNNHLKQIKIKKIKEEGLIEGNINWIALETRYFMSSVITAEGAQGKMILEENEDIIRSKLVLNNGSLGPQERKTNSVDLYFGPKSLKELKKLDRGLDRAIYFGWFDFIAKPCLWFMNFLYSIIPNYGVAIIILTIITRVAFWPLAKKGYKSMGEMRKIQPLMQEVREKYKDDKTKMNQEMMALYRTYKINPLGGCLPMLIQLPVFFALYRMLYQAIELRHAPFIWWINDLSAPDRLFHFSFKIPFMQPPYGIPVLTLIMGASMFVQQKMTPSPGDPTQAKMMMIMPIVFTVIFINFSSGLVLYWLVSNILSLAQQYYTQKKVV